jgi:hypothetical protein
MSRRPVGQRAPMVKVETSLPSDFEKESGKWLIYYAVHLLEVLSVFKKHFKNKSEVWIEKNIDGYGICFRLPGYISRHGRLF